MAQGLVGAQLYTLREHTRTAADFAKSMKKVAEIGYTAVQISAIGPIDPKDVVRITDDHGLTIASTHISWERFLNNLDDLIEEHSLWRCKHPAIGGLPEPYHSAEGLKRFLEEIPPIAEKLAKAGMDFSYHNHNRELARINHTTWLAALYEQSDPRHVKAELDTYWIQAGGGDPAAWVRKCAGREPLLHLKDMAFHPKEGVRFAEIGEGNLNWPAILEAARAGGVEWYLVEQDTTYGRDPFESLAISYRNLRAMGLR